MAFSKARNKRFNEVLSCAPPPGHYNPKTDRTKLPGAYIEKTERFRPLVKESPSKSLSSNPGTSKSCSEHHDSVLPERKFSVGRRLLVMDSRVKEFNCLVADKEQQLFELRATLAHLIEKRDGYVDVPEEHSRIKQLKRSEDDSDSEATLSADEASEDNNFEVEFLRNKLSKAEAMSTREKMENLTLAKKLNKAEELLQREKRKSKKMLFRLKKATARNGKPNAMKMQVNQELVPSSSNSKTIMQPETQPSLQHKLAGLDSEILSLKRSIEWVKSINEKKSSSNEAFWCGISAALPFQNSQEFQSLTYSADVCEEVTNIRNSICYKLEDHLTNEKQILNVCSNVVELYSHEVDALREYKNVAGEYIAQVEICIKNNLSEFLEFYSVISCEQARALCTMKQAALLSTDDSIQALNELQKFKAEIDALTNVLESERKSHLIMLQDNKRLYNENQKLMSTVVGLHEEIDALNSRLSEMSGTLARNNEQINELNAENERQSLDISTLCETVSTLESNIKQLSAEKEAVVQSHFQCAPLRREIEDLRTCYRVECNKNKDLINEVASSKAKMNEMENEIIHLHRYIGQMKLDNQSLRSEFELQFECLKKSIATEEVRNSKFIQSASERLELLKQQSIEENNELLQMRDRLKDELNKLVEGTKLQEQLYKEQISSLGTKCDAVSSEMGEKLKKYEDEKENWKTLYLNLEAKIAPFKEELDGYEAEKKLLLCRNDEQQHELEMIYEKFAKLIGHQNQKQKIKYVQKIKDENMNLKREISELQKQLHKKTSIIRKLKSGGPWSNHKDTKCQDVLKENRPNT